MTDESERLKDATVIFDLDGTLIDSAPDLLAVLNRILVGKGASPVSETAFRPFISRGARKLIELGFQASKRSLKEGELDKMFAAFLEDYQTNLTVKSAPFPGVERALRELREHGARLGVCTNKREDMSGRLLRELGLLDYFSAVIGADTLPVSKPDPLHLITTIERAGGDPGRAVMVGDSLNDIAVAKAANIPVIAVSFGYSDQPVKDLSPNLVIDNYGNLLGAVKSLLEQGHFRWKHILSCENNYYTYLP